MFVKDGRVVFEVSDIIQLLPPYACMTVIVDNCTATHVSGWNFYLDEKQKMRRFTVSVPLAQATFVAKAKIRPLSPQELALARTKPQANLGKQTVRAVAQPAPVASAETKPSIAPAPAITPSPGNVPPPVTVGAGSHSPLSEAPRVATARAGVVLPPEESAAIDRATLVPKPPTNQEAIDPELLKPAFYRRPSAFSVHKHTQPAQPMEAPVPVNNTTLPTPQCSTGDTQSRPFPARAGKVMESAGQTTQHAANAAQNLTREGQSPGTGESVTAGETAPVPIAQETKPLVVKRGRGRPRKNPLPVQ